MYITVNGLTNVGKSTLIQGMKQELRCDALDIETWFFPFSYLDWNYKYDGNLMLSLMSGAGYGFRMFRDVEYVVFENFLLSFYRSRQHPLWTECLDLFKTVYAGYLDRTWHFWLDLDATERMERRARYQMGYGRLDIQVKPDVDADRDENELFAQWLASFSDVFPNFYVIDASLSESEVLGSVLAIVGKESL